MINSADHETIVLLPDGDWNTIQVRTIVYAILKIYINKNYDQEMHYKVGPDFHLDEISDKEVERFFFHCIDWTEVRALVSESQPQIKLKQED